ncbi:MAG: cobalamin biosynthesis protein [Oscillospiraceae bacterium]|nr:cobalamin biosynthesis protein [Oscillospiraceae bacterium]
MIAVISFTDKGRQLSGRIAAAFPAERWCFHTHTDDAAKPFLSVTDLTAGLFDRVDALVFVCAAGIAVRSVAPHLRSKAEDPAVLVVDDCGKYVIPLLSGHIGGANALAQELAAAIGAEPVITTATDAGKAFSPDCYAESHNLAIGDLSAAKAVAAAVLDGEPVGFVSRLHGYALPDGLSPEGLCRTGICITESTQDSPFTTTLQLFPRNYVLGIGCKKGTSAEQIEAHVQHCCAVGGIPAGRLRACATISLKAQEPGLLTFCRRHRLPLVTYTAEQLMAIDGVFSASAFVRETTGADNVCERSAVLCSGGRLLVRKTAANGVTAAIAQDAESITQVTAV